MPSNQSLLKRMKEIVSTYEQYLSHLDTNDLEVNEDSSTAMQNIRVIYVSRVFRAFMKLSEKEKQILNNEYFERKKFGWWADLYSKEEFEKLHIQSIRNFIRRFDNNET